MNIFSEIHEILFHGNGGYDYFALYNMPIWLRKFTYNKLKQYYDEKEKNNENWMVNEDKPNTVIDKSDLLNNLGKGSTYNVKAPKK